jgi:O-succinylbenzoate synthase
MDRRGLVVTLTDEMGHVGFGEASPLPDYSPDTLLQCERALEGAALPRHLPESLP